MSIRVIEAGRKLGERVATIEVQGLPENILRERMKPTRVSGSVVQLSRGFGRDLSVNDWAQWAQERLACM